MRVALVVFANKYTGAAAVAEHFCRALHTAEVDARLLYVAGRNLERRLRSDPWAEAGLLKERTPVRILRNLRTLRRVAEQVDLTICHLPHDHTLCVAAGVHLRSLLVRSFRRPRHLRRDPWHRAMARPLSGALVAFDGMSQRLVECHGALPWTALPVPVEDRFRPDSDGTAWRDQLAIPDGAPVLGMVGKVAPGRGFDLLLETAVRCRSDLHVVAVGHGEARRGLERLSFRLGLTDRVRWTGYQEARLPELYAAMDVVLFVTSGSDSGHRVITEAQACARTVVAARVSGVEALVQDRIDGRLSDPAPEALASVVSELLSDPAERRRLGSCAAKAASRRRFAPLGRRLAEFLGSLIDARSRGAGSRA